MGGNVIILFPTVFTLGARDLIRDSWHIQRYLIKPMSLPMSNKRQNSVIDSRHRVFYMFQRPFYICFAI